MKEDAENMNLEVEYEVYEHTESGDQPEDFDIVLRWRHFLDDYMTQNQRDSIVLITEVSSSPGLH